MSLSTVPPGTNPYAAYRQAIEGSLYSDAPGSFKIRLGVLFGLCALLIVLAIVNWVLLVLEAKQHKRGSPYWLFRLADRQSGRFIVTNGKLVLSLFSVITASVFIGQLVDLWNVFIDHKSQSRSSIIRTFAVLPLLLQGWLMPFAALQASRLASDHNDGGLLRAWAANFLFAGVGGIIFVGVVVSGVINAQAGQAVWNQASKVIGQLRSYEAGWMQGQNTLPTLLTLAPELQELQKRSNYNQRVQLISISFWTAIPVLVILVNLASLRLSRLIHKQVQFNIEQFIGPLGTETHLSHRSGGSNTNLRPLQLSTTTAPKEKETHLGDSLLPIANPVSSSASAHPHRGSHGADSLRQKLRDGRMSVSHLSRGDLMKLANRRASAPDRERIRHIQALQKAEKDLVVTSYVVLAAICGILGVCIYFLYVCAGNKLTGAGWPTYEAVFTTTIWIYAVALNLVFLSLIWFHWTGRAIKTGDQTSTTFFGQPTFTQADPTLSALSQSQSRLDFGGNGTESRLGERRGTVTIDFGGGVIGTPGGTIVSTGGAGSGAGTAGAPGGLHVPSHAGLSRQASKELESYAWGPRDGAESSEVLRLADEEDDERDGRVEVERRDSGRMSPTMKR
ncbi:hypothetical protein JCM8097_004998 [Rhodosporidiobolus ruineniae]